MAPAQVDLEITNPLINSILLSEKVITKRNESLYDIALNKNETITNIKFDTNEDGKPDQFQSFYQSGKLKNIEFDTNLNGQVDRWEFYNEDEKLKRVELDRNHDGKPDMINRK